MCSLNKNKGNLVLRIEALQGVESSNFRTLVGPFEIPVEWFPEISSEAQLLDFMKTQLDGTLPRYILDSLGCNLRIVERRYSVGTVYDLSLGNFDPREPSSPDVFVMPKGLQGAMRLKNAWNLEFSRQNAYLTRSRRVSGYE